MATSIQLCRMLIVSLILALLLEGSLLLTPPHAAAQEPPPLQSQELEAQGTPTDPLAGNYNVLNWDRIATFWTEDDWNKANTKMYAEGETLGDPTPKAKNAHNMSLLAARDVAVMRINDAHDDVVGAGVASDHHIWLFASQAADDLNSYVLGGNVNTGQTTTGAVAIAALPEGAGSGGGWNMKMAFQGLADQSIFLQSGAISRYFDSYSGNELVRVVPLSAPVSSLDLATGDLNGDGHLIEGVVAWTETGTRRIKLQVFVGDGPDLTPARYDDAVASDTAYVSVAIGDVNNDRVNEIIAVWGDNSGRKVQVKVFQVSADLNKLTPMAAYTIPDAIWQPTVALGDFDLDGAAEIVVSAKNWSDAKVRLYLFATTVGAKGQWTLIPKVNNFTLNDKIHNYPRLAVGDVNQDVVPEIVVTYALFYKEIADEDVYSPVIQVIEIVPDSSEIWSASSKGRTFDNDEDVNADGYSSVLVALGNLDAKQIRVGPPTYTQINDARQILAVVSEPPKHYDVVNGATIEFSNNRDTFVKYDSKSSSEAGQTTGSHGDWKAGADFELEFKIPEVAAVKTHWKAMYGRHWENETGTFTTSSFGAGTEAKSDDVIFFTMGTYDAWEYPTYSNSSDTVKGHLLIMFPQKKDPTCITNCDPKVVIQRMDSKNWNYQTEPTFLPTHENHNVLSYPIHEPASSVVSQTIKCDFFSDLGSNTWDWWYEWGQSATTHHDSGFLADVETPVFAMNYEGVNTQDSKVETSTAFHIYYPGQEDNLRYGFSLEPCLYYAKPDNRVVWDYVVQIPHDDQHDWHTTYSQADPALTLPWKYDKDGNGNPVPYRFRSRDIVFTPASPKAGEAVTVTVKVHNYSPSTQAKNVTVHFYQGDPDNGGAEFGQQTIGTLNPMETAMVVGYFTNTGALANKAVDIYAKIAPYPNETHADNNKAYATLAIKANTPRESPASLSAASSEIEFDPAPITLGQPTVTTVTVRAQGESFTYVSAELWAGDPMDGGQFMGNQLIPIVPQDEAVTVGIPWTPAGAAGVQQIWLVVRGVEYDDSYDDNRAYRTLQVIPQATFLPVILK